MGPNSTPQMIIHGHTPGVMLLPGIFKFNYYTLTYYLLILFNIISKTQANSAGQIMHDNNVITKVTFNYKTRQHFVQ